MLWIPIFIVFGLIRPGIEPESAVLVVGALFTPSLNNVKPPPCVVYRGGGGSLTQKPKIPFALSIRPLNGHCVILIIFIVNDHAAYYILSLIVSKQQVNRFFLRANFWNNTENMENNNSEEPSNDDAGGELKLLFTVEKRYHKTKDGSTVRHIDTARYATIVAKKYGIRWYRYVFL